MVILCAVGEKHHQERIIGTGLDLAAAYDDQLEVLHVIPRDDAERHFEAIRSIDEFRDAAFSMEAERAAEIAESWGEMAGKDESSVDVDGIGRVGDPAREILAVEEAHEPRYLVIGGRKRSPAGKAVFGSVTQSVILESTCPTVTVMGE